VKKGSVQKVMERCLEKVKQCNRGMVPRNMFGLRLCANPRWRDKYKPFLFWTELNLLMNDQLSVTNV